MNKRKKYQGGSAFWEGFSSINLFGGPIILKKPGLRTPGDYFSKIGKYFPRLPEGKKKEK